MLTKIGLRGGGTRLPHRGEPRAVARDCLVAGIESLEQSACNIRTAPVLGKAEEGPGAFPKAFDETGFGQKLQVARDARLRLSQDVREIGDGQFRLGQKRQDA